MSASSVCGACYQVDSGCARGEGASGGTSLALGWHFPCSMRPARRILGLPVDAALIIAGVLVVLALFAGVVIPGARRRDRARDGGTYSGDRRRG